MPTTDHASALPHGPRHGWLLALPGIGISALVLAVFALLWVLHRGELEDQRATLIADVLWLEQNFRFHLASNEEQLQQLSLDLARAPDGAGLFRLRVTHLLKTAPELVQVLQFDAQGQALAGIPSTIPPDDGRSEAAAAILPKAFDMARRLGKPVLSDPFLIPGKGARFVLLVPIFEGRQVAGMLAGVVDMELLLRELVPWWFTQKYRVRITDDNGAAYVSKSNVDQAAADGPSYDLTLEIPGNARFSVTAYHGGGNPAQRILAGVIVTLAAGVLTSLWAIRGLMRRRLETEQALREAHAFRKAMEDSLTVGMRARDLKGRIIYVNPAFCRMVGWSAEELVGLAPPMPYWLPEELEATRAIHDVVLAGQAPQEGIELHLMRRNGERFDAHIFESPLIDAQGHQTGWMGSVLDITERKRSEELYRQQQEKLQFTSRLVTMGELASTLAHELNQPLSAIASYAAGCLNRIEAENVTAAELKPPLSKLAAQAQRAGQIIRRVHDFVRRSEPRRSTCDLNTIIEDAVGLLEATAKNRGVRIRLELAEHLPTLLADRVMVEQVALNLLRNGMDAMADTVPEERLLLVSTRQMDQEIDLAITDMGSGITPAVAEKLFAPFFSTKAEGMGMGLNICRSIAELHHGRLWFEPHLPRGTVFHLSLPVESR